MKTVLTGTATIQIPVNDTDIGISDPGGYYGGPPLTLADVLALIGSGTLTGYLRSSGGEVHVIDTSHATLTGTATFDLANGNVHPGTLTGDVTISTTGWPATGSRGYLGWTITGDGTSTPTFSGVTWIGSAPGVIGSGDFIDGVLWSDDGGTLIKGVVVGGTSAGTYVLTIEGGQETVNARGTLGATETVDPTDGNIITGTLDQACTITISAPTGSGGSSLEWWLSESGGSWTPTFAPTGGTFQWDGGVTPTFPAAGQTFRVVTERIPGTTNDWIGNVLGSGSGGGTAATTVTDETTFGITPAVGTDTEYARQDHTHGSPANPVTTATQVWMPLTTVDGGEPVLVWDGDDSLIPDLVGV